MSITRAWSSRVLGCVISAAVGSAAIADSPELAVPDLEPGWTWELEPQGFEDWWITAGITHFIDSGVISLNAGPDGTATVLHVRTRSVGLRGAEQPHYDIHLMTRSGERPMVRQSMFMPSDEMVTVRLVYAIEDLADVIGLGVAVLTLEGRQEVAAKYTPLAQEAGIEVLPLPLVNEPFAFALQDINDRPLTSDSLRGDVLLIVSWASWCGPCIAKVPELKALHEAHADAGLRIIGLNFDREWDPAQKAIDEHGMAWPQVHAAVDEEHRKYWRNITGITYFPRMFIVDREGLLRADDPTGDLEEILSAYLE